MNTLWIEYIQAIGPTIVAIIVAYIAFQQYRINKKSLKERLYDRRWKTFEEAHHFIDKVLAGSKITLDDINNFGNTCLNAEFLFGYDVRLELAEIHSDVSKVALKQMRKNIKSRDSGEVIKSEIDPEIIKRVAERQVRLRKLFLPYLSFTSLK